jgi:cytochrome c biogenesis protein CcmG, thiol:disulfide interchange protein DsbE
MLAPRRRTARVSRLAVGLAALLAAASCLAAAPELPPDFARYRGQVVVVDFWASWCKPCRQSIPWLNDLRARYGAQGLVIVGVNVDANRVDADRFQRDVRIDFEVRYDPQGKLAEQFGLQGMPTSYVFDRDGKLVHTLLGYREARRDDHETEILNLLKRKSS